MEFMALDPFPTPILIKRWEKVGPMNEALKAAIHRRMKIEPGVEGSNRGGWHSKTDLRDWDEPVLDDFHNLATLLSHEYIRTIMRIPEDSYEFDWEYGTWCVVNGQGDYNIPHCHPRASWSAVYYVLSDPPPARHPESGKLSLQDPRTGISTARPAAMYGHRWHDIVPETGMMVMWPGWLTHFVHPYQGSSERIVIALDAIVTDERYDFTRIETVRK